MIRPYYTRKASGETGLRISKGRIISADVPKETGKKVSTPHVIRVVTGNPGLSHSTPNSPMSVVPSKENKIRPQVVTVVHGDSGLPRSPDPNRASIASLGVVGPGAKN